MTVNDLRYAPPLRGRFHRAVDPRFRHLALAGSRMAGRYSRPDEPTLYLSSSPEGVAAAMVAHRSARSGELVMAQVDVTATRIVDLRRADALDAVGLEIADAVAPWQEVAARGGTPRSWLVRDRLLAAGAHGLVDPSRQQPGLWHLVLFRWNVDGAPHVRLVEGDTGVGIG